MDRDTLRKGLSAVQETMRSHEANKERHARLMERARQLRERLQVVFTYLNELEQIIPGDGYYSSHPIVLENIKTDDPQEPDGVDQVSIKNLGSNLTERVWGSGVDASAYDLHFGFRPEGENRKYVPKGSESTAWKKSKDKNLSFNSSPVHGVADPTLNDDTLTTVITITDETETAWAEQLRAYEEIYLSGREKEIAALETSIAWIQEALEDEALNPWYTELIEAKERPERERQERHERDRAEIKTAVESLGSTATHSSRRRRHVRRPHYKQS